VLLKMLLFTVVLCIVVTFKAVRSVITHVWFLKNPYPLSVQKKLTVFSFIIMILWGSLCTRAVHKETKLFFFKFIALLPT